jgi:hypothetical protein
VKWGLREREYTSAAPNPSTTPHAGASAGSGNPLRDTLFRVNRHFRARSPGSSRSSGFELRLGVAIAALVLAFAAAAATAAGLEDRSEADVRRARVEQWKGRYCTPTGCAGTDESPWSRAAGFGAVVIATGWIARRRPSLDD